MNELAQQSSIRPRFARTQVHYVAGRGLRCRLATGFHEQERQRTDGFRLALRPSEARTDLNGVHTALLEFAGCQCLPRATPGGFCEGDT